MRWSWVKVVIAVVLLGLTLPGNGVIFSGVRERSEFGTGRRGEDSLGCRWSDGWKKEAGALRFNESSADEAQWVESRAIPMGSGSRLGLGYGGVITVDYDPAGLGKNDGTTLPTIICEFRTAEDEDDWTSWTVAALSAVCEPTSGSCFPSYPKDSSVLQFAVRGELHGPSKAKAVELLATHGMDLITTTITPLDGRAPFESTENHHWALRRLPQGTELPPAGYFQFRIVVSGNTPFLLNGVSLELSTIESGLSP